MQDFPLWDESSLLLLISATRRRIRQVAWRWLAPYDVTPQQYMVLMVLLEKPGLSLRELAELVWVDNPTASRIVKNLQERGLVEVSADPGHGRRLKLGLTSAGKDLATSLRRVRKCILDGMEVGFSASDSEAVRKSLRRVMVNLANLERDGIPAEIIETAKAK